MIFGSKNKHDWNEKNYEWIDEIREFSYFKLKDEIFLLLF